MHPARRSGRIAKELDILLLGTDAYGKVFSEKTNTVVLSRHGAGIVSRYRFSPDEALTLRLAGSAKEAEVRLVGQIGGEPGRYVYGLAFVDPHIEFWALEFPPPEPFEAAGRRRTLECSFCGACESVEQVEVEEDVYSVNESILRLCKNCGISTPWKKSLAEAQQPLAPAVALPVAPVVPPAPIALAPPTAPLKFAPRAQSAVPELAPVTSAYSGGSGAALLAATPHSSYSSSHLDTLPTSAAEFALAIATPAISAPVEATPSIASQTSSPQRPIDATGRKLNRRKHMRVRVNFNACVRHAEFGEEVVECENVSKGGLCFRSLRHYAVDSALEIAAPYKEGEPALFVPARIRRAERIVNSDLSRYGVSYLPSNSNEPSR